MPPKSDLQVPPPGDPDRKRALSVIAQRRYRRRKQERIQELEEKLRLSLARPKSPTSISEMTVNNTRTPTSSEDQENYMLSRADLRSQCESSSDSLEPPSFDFNTSFGPMQLQFPQTAGALCAPNPGALSFSPYFQEMWTDSLLSEPLIDFNSALQNLECSRFTFPDDTTLEMPELQVLKAGNNIATMLGCVDTLWDFSSCRVFTKSSIPTPNIPPNLEPIAVQQNIPHHPLFDILPWPTVRKKLIMIFAQPIHLRPPLARDPMALMQLVYDMDDSTEGLRVSGSDWSDGKNWEVGQALFKNWWWVLDQAVVENSNALRAKRGAKRLTLEAP